MTDHVAPQEDQLILPTAWASRALSRRGRRSGKPVALDAEAGERLQRKLEARTEKLRLALAREDNAEHADAVEAYLAGKPDPHGAAVAAALMCDPHARRDESWLRPEFDAWVQWHGAPFAVAAAVVRLALRHDSSSGSGYEQRTVVENTVEYHSLILHEYDQGGVGAVRSLIADLSDADYAEAVALTGPQRTTPMRRITAAVLLPDETAWVDEAAPEYAQVRSYGWSDRLFLHSISSADQLDAAGIGSLNEYYTDAGSLAALLANLGADALPLLTAPLTQSGHLPVDFKKLLYKGVAAVPTDEAMALLLKQLGEPHVFESAADAVQRFPQRALRHLVKLAASTTGDARFRLSAVGGLIPEAERDRLAEADRAVFDTLLAGSGRAPEADPADLPALLVTPPWKAKRAKRTPVVIDGLQAPADLHLRWARNEQEEWAGLTEPWAMDDESYWKDLEDPDAKLDSFDWRMESFLAYGDPAKAERFLDQWIEHGYSGYEYTVLRIFARYGERAADRALGSAERDHTFQRLPGPVLNLRAARLAAERLDRLKSARVSAAKWFERHGLDAVPYLVPDALGADKKRRQYAETALLHLSLRHGPEAVAARAETYGPEATAAIADLLSGDPLEPRGVKVPKPGAWASPALLPQVLLKGGERALPAESVGHLLTVVALASPEYPYPGLDVVADACDRASLTRFARALFQLWISVGAPAKDSWALTQLGHFAEDETVWMLAPLIREWPGQSQHKRAVNGLAVLGAIGSEEALRAIQVIADRVKFKALKEEANRQIAHIAAELGLTRDQLADRLVPDFGLGEDAALVLDYGPRTFTVGFDEALKPFVVDEAGKPRKVLPKPGAKDDADLAGAAYQRFTALKKELRAVAADQILRLEAAMTGSRTWSAAEFRRFFVDHALTKHLARRLVWTAAVGDDRSGFRIAEDGSFSDVEDEAFDLPEDAAVSVAHPALLGDEVAAWAEILADYEILQPFDQLDRPVLAFTEEELATGRLTRFEGATVEPGRVLGMVKRGWQRAAPEDAGVEPGIAYRLPGGGFVTVSLDPGIYVGAISETPQQTVQDVRLSDHEQYWWSAAKDTADRKFPKDVGAVAAAEVLGSLSRLTGRS
ncbi:protein of unknown function [Glycomyces sambucus]|uniref:DUF4132 domain-containing protein n=1 Tax=Glycomyces sambucus TaxID=380244 RepID=A0A1G9IK06_9ACTN|nr:DUF4132 domain-containing protein [Glycomyces sambucus]SDL25365.1 protein of unknown function [Glycomyces sambucus]